MHYIENSRSVAYPQGDRGTCPPDFRPGDSHAKVPHFLTDIDAIKGSTSQSLGLPAYACKAGSSTVIKLAPRMHQNLVPRIRHGSSPPLLKPWIRLWYRSCTKRGSFGGLSSRLKSMYESLLHTLQQKINNGISVTARQTTGQCHIHFHIQRVASPPFRHEI